MKTIYSTAHLWVRNLVYWVFIVITTILASTILFILWPLPDYKRHCLGMFWPDALRWALRHIVGLKYHVIYEGALLQTPAIICSKHQSGWETIALQGIFPPQVFVTKKELLFLPFFGWGLALMNAIGIERADPTKAFRQMIRQGQKRIRQGFWIVIFPEGTRIKPGQKGEYKIGAVLLAKQLQVPIVPVAHNAGEFWPKKSFLKYPGDVTVVVGSPIQTNTDKSNVILKQLETWIENHQHEIGGAGPCADPEERAIWLSRHK